MAKVLNRVAVVGAGYMGGGIAQSLALAGYDVTIADADKEKSQAAILRLLQEAKDFEHQGLFPEGAAKQISDHLQDGGSIEAAVKDADFIEEAVFEVPEVKKAVLKQISSAARTDAIIGTNTSTIPVHILEPAVTHPERFLTVHFFNPAPFVPGVELVASAETSQDSIDSVKELLTRCGRQGVQEAETPGLVLNRLQYVLLKEACDIVEQGITTVEDLDAIVRTSFGFRLGFFGPFAVADQAGLDVYVNCFKTFEENYGERLRTPKLLVDQVEHGRLGTKNGRGLTGDFDDASKESLIAYRNRAYVKMQQLLSELGPAPSGRK
jgi:3-hydroxybutyryl-CoA dehydrogenase